MAQGDVGIYASQISGHLWAPNGAYDALATVTVPSGGVASVEFAGIPQGYKHLQIRISSYNTSSQGNFQMNFNGDSSTNYAYHYVRGNGSAAQADYGNNNTYEYLNYDNNSGGTYAARVVDILDYSSTSKFKTTRTLGGWDANGSGIVFLQSNLWFKAGSGTTAEAINSIKFTYNAGNFAQHSQFALYGVK